MEEDKLATLPTELWYLIANHATRHDLTALARVSFAFLDLVRQILYRHLVLEEGIGLADATLALLRSSSATARKVETLQLIGRRDWDAHAHHIPCSPSAWMDLEILKELGSLRTLILHNSPLAAGAGLALSALIKAYCPELKTFELTDCFALSSPTDQFPIAGIERLRWDSPYYAPAFVLITVSAETITHLYLELDMENDHVAEFFPICQLHIPRLKVLHLAAWEDHEEDLSGPMTSFFNRHPSIEELRLGHSPSSRWRVSVDPSLVTPETLPNLITLNSSAANLRIFAQKRCRFLKRLVRLSTGHGDHEDAYDDVSDMTEAFVAIGGLPSLKSLVFLPGKELADVDLDDFGDWMQDLSRACPKLENWEGDLPTEVHLGKTVQMFSRFPKLLEVNVRSLDAPEPKEMSRIDAARALGAHCPGLKRVQFGQDHDTPPQALDIERNEDGYIIGITPRTL